MHINFVDLSFNYQMTPSVSYTYDTVDDTSRRIPPSESRRRRASNLKFAGGDFYLSWKSPENERSILARLTPDARGERKVRSCLVSELDSYVTHKSYYSTSSRENLSFNT